MGPSAPPRLCCAAPAQEEYSSSREPNFLWALPSPVHAEPRLGVHGSLIPFRKSVGRTLPKRRFPRHVLLCLKGACKGQARLAASAVVLRERIRKNLALLHLLTYGEPPQGRAREGSVLRWGKGRHVQQGEPFCLDLFLVEKPWLFSWVHTSPKRPSSDRALIR